MNALLRCTLAFSAGVLGRNLFPELKVGNEPVIAAGGLLILLVFFVLRLGNRYLLGVLTFLLFAVLGWIRTPSLEPPSQIDQMTAYEAVVLSPPETRAKSYKIEATILKVQQAGQWKLFSEKWLLYLDKTAPKPRYGDVLLVRGMPRLVEPPLNPAQFDYRKFLSYKQIFRQHYLRGTDFIRIGRQSHWLNEIIYAVSEWSDAALHRLVPYDREYAVAKAMVLGLRDEMDNELVQAYSAAGAVHVLSVSGFHITVFIGIITFFLGRLQKRRRGRWLYLGITLTTMWFYAVLTGLSAPVIRSALMFTIFLLAKPFGRKENSTNALFGSALVLLAIDPLLIYSVSFQLSYAALGGILFLQPVLYQSLSFKDWFRDKIWAITAVAIAAQLIAFPIIAFYFHQFPNYFWLVNPVVVGLSFVMLPIAFAAIAFSWVPFLAEGLGWVLTGITWLLNESVIGTEKLPFAVWDNLSLSGFELSLIYLLIGLVIVLVYYRNVQWGYGIAVVSLLLLGVQIKELVELRNQKWIVIHAVPRQTAITLIDGQRAVLAADSAFFQPDRKPFSFYLNNFYTERGIRYLSQEPLDQQTETIQTLPFGKLLVWQGQSVLLVEKTITGSSLPITDFVLIRNNAFRDARALQSVFGNRSLIFDNSNKFYVLDTLQKTAVSQQLPWYFTDDKGAFIARF
ncbi:MAG: ComEC/Rec2 family competence protein [Spirosomataceae bacterium]